MELAPCRSCRRHVRIGDRICPFCFGQPGDPAGVELPFRLSRGAAVAFVAMSLAGCTEPEVAKPDLAKKPIATSEPTPVPSPTTTAVPQPPSVAAYGAPAPPPSTSPSPAPRPSTSTPPPVPAPKPDPVAVPAYGAPPPVFPSPKAP